VRVRLTLIVVVSLLIAVGAFVWLHSDARGDAACRRALFVPSDGFSAWPPGARCTYGLPARTDVVMNGWFAAVIVVLILTFVGALMAIRSADCRRQEAR
jgi:hypothetical protein